MWSEIASPPLAKLQTQFLDQYAALTTNTQFVERDVKESALGRRGEENRTILTIARGKVLPEALLCGRQEIDMQRREESESNRR